MGKYRLPVILLLGLIIILLVILLVAEKQEKNKVVPDQNKLGLEVFQKNKATYKQINWIGRWENEGNKENFQKDLANNYEFLHQNLIINLTNPSEIGDKPEDEIITDIIVKMIETSTYSWDIVWINEVIYKNVAARINDLSWGKKYLVNFENIPGFKQAHNNFIFNNKSVIAADFNNQIFGPYIEGNYFVLWYNAELTEKIGIEIKETGMSFNDFLDYIDVIQKYNSKYNTNYAPIYESNDKLLMELLFQNLYLSEIENEIDRSDKLKLQALRKTLEAFEELGQKKPLIKSHVKNDWFETRRMVLDNKAVFYVSGLEMYNHWKSIDEDKASKMKPVELPVFRENDFVLGYFYPTWSVLKGSPNEELAVDILLNISNRETGKYWQNISMNPTGLKTPEIADFFKNDEISFIDKIENKYNYNVYYYPVASYLTGEMNNRTHQLLTTDLREILNGDKTADEAFNNLLNNLNFQVQ
ncbi:hypothetical protein ACFLTE_05165 [Bacteroidota bacterium]